MISISNSFVEVRIKLKKIKDVDSFYYSISDIAFEISSFDSKEMYIFVDEIYNKKDRRKLKKKIRKLSKKYS